MIKNMRFADPLPPDLMSHIIEMAHENWRDLTVQPTQGTTILDEYIQTRLTAEVAGYLTAIGDPHQPGNGIEVIVALEMNGRILNPVGFLLFCQLTGGDGGCGIYYTVVKHSHRKQGVLRGMLDTLLDLYPSAALSCEIDKVPLYEHLGFKVYGQHDTQVQMTYASDDDTGVLPLLDPQMFDHHPMVQSVVASWPQRYSQDQMTKAITEHANYTQQRVKLAEQYVQSRLAKN